MDRFEKRTKCLLCVQHLNSKNGDDGHTPFRKTKLFKNCAQSMCRVLLLPNYPFEYFFESAGYCNSCRQKVEELELLFQKLKILQDDLEERKKDIETGMKNAYKVILKSSKKSSVSIKIPPFEDIEEDDFELLRKQKFNFRQVLKVIVEKLEENPFQDRGFSLMDGSEHSFNGYDEYDMEYSPVDYEEDEDYPVKVELKIGKKSNRKTTGKIAKRKASGKFTRRKTKVKQENVKASDKPSNRKTTGSISNIKVTGSPSSSEIAPPQKRGRGRPPGTGKKSNLRTGVGLVKKEEVCDEEFLDIKGVALPYNENIGKVENSSLLNEENDDPDWIAADDNDENETKTVNRSSRKPRRLSVSSKKSRNSGQVSVPCPYTDCTEVFISKGDLRNHIREKHSEDKHKCDECDKQYRNRKHLLDHKRVKHSEVSPSYDCELCGVSFTYAKGLKAHRLKKHPDEFADLTKAGDGECLVHLACVFENCTEIFMSRINLSAHIKENHKGEKRFTCDQCGKKYCNKKHLDVHVKVKHSGKFPLVCDKCGKSFNFAKGLLNHIETKHNEFQFSCHVCSKKFKSDEELSAHASIHQDDIPFRCDSCEMLFTNSMDLAYHVRTHESNQVKCELCGKIYASQKNLKDHQLSHNDISTWPKCTVCSKPFKSPRHLRKHMIVHSVTNQFQCELCGEEFKYSSYLLKHKRRVHSMIKPFSCKICSKAFYESTQLKRHEEIHSGFKKYMCDICGKAFRTLQNHYQHYRSHTRKTANQDVYKKIKKRVIKSTRKKVSKPPEITIATATAEEDDLDSIHSLNSNQDDDDMEEAQEVVQIPASELPYYGETIVVVNDFVFHKYTTY